MNLRFVLSAFAAASIVASVPTLAAAQTTTTGPDGRTVISSTPVPNPPERSHMMHHRGRHVVKHHRKHHVVKHHRKHHVVKHHRRHHNHGAVVSHTARSDADKK